MPGPKPLEMPILYSVCFVITISLSIVQTDLHREVTCNDFLGHYYLDGLIGDATAMLLTLIEPGSRQDVEAIIPNTVHIPLNFRTPQRI